MKKINFKKFLLFVVILVVFLWTSFVLIGQFRIRFAEKKYYRNYVKIVNFDFNKYKENAALNVAIENFGRRLLDSIVVKIDYYDAKGKKLGSDISDVLKMSNDFLYPQAGKVFRIDVICPEETIDIKLSIK